MHQQSQVSKVLLDGLYDGESNLSLLRTRQHVMKKVGLNLSLIPVLCLVMVDESGVGEPHRQLGDLSGRASSRC